MTTVSPAAPAATQIDPRGPRFTASVTMVLLGAVLLAAPAPAALALLALQTAFFAIGAGRGVQYTPTAYVFRKAIRPRLAAPTHLEDAAPPRFAQAIGLAFAVAALTAFVLDATLLGQIFSGFALAASTLNAVFGFCVGCEVYLLGKRLAARSTRSTSATTTEETTKEEVAA